MLNCYSKPSFGAFLLFPRFSNEVQQGLNYEKVADIIFESNNLFSIFSYRYNKV
jgi:hypothetical protein